jgi:pimeloyl-ACP methyl ester carboxylesterase
MMTNTALLTNTLELAEVDLAYDVRGPLPTADGRPVLLMIGQPMDANGFTTLASFFPDRTVVTYDPRGLGRSTRKDGRTDNTPQDQARDVHALIEALGTGAVDMFASSGGAVTALELVATFPDDIATLVAHEPPVMTALPDAAAALRAQTATQDVYRAKGWGAGMANFIAMTSWQGEYTDDYFAQPPADPAMFGMPTEDDGSRDDPLLSDSSSAVTAFRPDVQALLAAPTRVVLAVGEESIGTFTGRTAVAVAEQLGQQATVFPSHHGGFLGGEHGYAGQPEAFADKLREVLDDDRQTA